MVGSYERDAEEKMMRDDRKKKDRGQKHTTMIDSGMFESMN